MSWQRCEVCGTTDVFGEHEVLCAQRALSQKLSGMNQAEAQKILDKLGTQSPAKTDSFP